MVIRKIALPLMLFTLLSGCFMAPLALVGPATSGFSTASLIQSGVSAGANYMVKKSTGKTITEHALDTFEKDILSQTYMQKDTNNSGLTKIDSINLYTDNLKVASQKNLKFRFKSRITK